MIYKVTVSYKNTFIFESSDSVIIPSWAYNFFPKISNPKLKLVIYSIYMFIAEKAEMTEKSRPTFKIATMDSIINDTNYNRLGVYNGYYGSKVTNSLQSHVGIITLA